MEDNFGDIFIVNGRAVNTSSGVGAFNTTDNLVDVNSVITVGDLNLDGLVEVSPDEGMAFYLINSGLHRYYTIKAIIGSSDLTSNNMTNTVFPDVSTINTWVANIWFYEIEFSTKVSLNGKTRKVIYMTDGLDSTFTATKYHTVDAVPDEGWKDENYTSDFTTLAGATAVPKKYIIFEDGASKRLVFINTDYDASSIDIIGIYRLGGEGGLLSKARFENGTLEDSTNSGFYHQTINSRTDNEATGGFDDSEAILIQSSRTLIGFKIPDDSSLVNKTLYLVANGQNNVTSWGDDSPTNLIIAKFDIVSPSSNIPPYYIDDLSNSTQLLSHPLVLKQSENLADNTIDGVPSAGATIITSHSEANIVAGLSTSSYAIPTSVQTDYTITLEGGGGPKINGTSVVWDNTGPMQALQNNTKYLINGEVVEFTVENTMTAVDHPWHPHGFSFQPIKIELNVGDPEGDGVDNYKLLYEWDFIEYIDVFNIPAKHRLTYRFRVEDRPYVNADYSFYWGGVYGRWLGHCHIFKHAHRGMMADMIVLDKDYAVHPNNFEEETYDNATSYGNSYVDTYTDKKNEVDNLVNYNIDNDNNPIGDPGQNDGIDDLIYEDLNECEISMTNIMITDASWWARSYHPPGLSPNGHYIRKFACDMTESEWSHTLSAFDQLCDYGIMHEMNLWHRGNYYMHTHSSPLSVRFGSWHRDFLRYFEHRLHEADPCAVLPIWNMEVERDPALTVLDTNHLNHPHDITDTTTTPSTTYSVNFGPGSGGALASVGSLQTILNQTELEPMLRSLQSTIHNKAHVWWSGSMGDTHDAAACLPFYALHGMIDWVIHHWLTGTSTSVPPVSSNKNVHLDIDSTTGAGTLYRMNIAFIIDGDFTTAGAIVANEWNWGLEYGAPGALSVLPVDGLLPDDSAPSHQHTPWDSHTYHSCDTRTPMLLSNWNSTMPGTDGSEVYPGYVYSNSICGTVG